ncbi:MAG: DUF5996 family protein, partial [Thiohalomonadales bacterium]
MTSDHYPRLNDLPITDSKNALHAYAGILGGWLKKCQAKRKHWWHASLHPSLNGLTTGVVHAEIDFEIELNLRESLLQCRTTTGKQLSEELRGQSAAELAGSIEQFLIANGLAKASVPKIPTTAQDTTAYTEYSPQQILIIAQVLNSVAATMNRFSGAVLLYKTLIEDNQNPDDYLLKLWRSLL